MEESEHPSERHVRNVHPPEWLMKKIVNPINRTVGRSPLGRLMGPVVVLEFDGRKSGKHYAVPVMSYDYNGATVVFTDGRWAANFKGGAPVVVHRRGQKYTMQSWRIATRLRLRSVQYLPVFGVPGALDWTSTLVTRQPMPNFDQCAR